MEHENYSHWCHRHYRWRSRKALALKKHDVVRTSRNGDVRVNLDDPPTIRAMFEKVRDVNAVISCAGNATFKPFADLTDADYELGLRSKLMGQVSLARMAKDHLRDGGSITLTDRPPLSGPGGMLV